MFFVVSIVVLAKIGYLEDRSLRSIGEHGVRFLERGDGLVKREVAIEAKEGDRWRDVRRDPDGNPSSKQRKFEFDDLHTRGIGMDGERDEVRREDVRGGKGMTGKLRGEREKKKILCK